MPNDGLELSYTGFMKANNRWLVTFFSSGLLVLALLIWILFAPGKLGGRVEYIFISGNSMEPGIHQGDLIIVRAIDDQKIGDAVAYHNAALNRVIFHRIVGGDSLHYLMQGDNNEWVDSYQPSAQEILGSQWIRIPNGGLVVEWIRKPAIAALSAGIMGALLMAFVLRKQKPKKSNLSSSPATPQDALREQNKPNEGKKVLTTIPPAFSASKGRSFMRSNQTSNFIEIGFFILGFLAIAFLLLFVVSFIKPTMREASIVMPYTQFGKYKYNAPAPSGIYNSMALNSGDPIFTKLTCKVNLQFSYRITGIGLENLSGLHQINALLSEPVSGWTRVFPLEKQQGFTGDNFSSDVLLDLCQIQAVAKAMETQTETTVYNYRILIQPNVSLSGTIAGTALQTAFDTPLTFQLESTRAYLVKNEMDIDPLFPVLEGSVESKAIEVNTINIFSLKIPVKTARILSTIGLLVSLAGLALLLRAISTAAKQDKGMLVRMKYSSSLVDVEPTFNPGSGTIVSVKQVDDLARIAEKLSTVILHREVNGQHVYYVEAGGLTYQCALDSDFQTEAPAPVPPKVRNR